MNDVEAITSLADNSELEDDLNLAFQSGIQRESNQDTKQKQSIKLYIKLLIIR